ncbi:hypothetical protein GCM10010399_64150 [Dactylosporangium fulvum]|uniref:Uncharacterized protein n=1 Tax=Dactylosporangium fulvum TaxID=53359 RepID=A0ABY5W6Q0_9ACTN|nr:hypothetical protein [Dactylosporangium fulvum]UWP85762.1 hypothetical protein Dfulv_16580 [Dactylosporangium fulvum]
MATFNAFVTTNEHHRLYPGSKVVVLDPVKGLVNARVQATAENGPMSGSVVWRHRMAEALATIGWRFTAGTDFVNDVANGLQGERTPLVRFNAEPVS